MGIAKLIVNQIYHPARVSFRSTGHDPRGTYLHLLKAYQKLLLLVPSHHLSSTRKNGSKIKSQYLRSSFPQTTAPNPSSPLLSPATPSTPTPSATNPPPSAPILPPLLKIPTNTSAPTSPHCTTRCRAPHRGAGCRHGWRRRAARGMS